MADNDPIEWCLYDTDLITKLAIVPYKKGSLYFEFQEVGSGKLEIALDSSVAPLITSGRFLTASYRGALRGGFFVEDFNIIEANESEGEGRTLSVTGKGPLSILTDAIVWYDSTQASTRTFLNMSKGKVFYTLITEAQARGGLAALEIDFSDTSSSDAVSWSDRGDYSIEVGKSLLDVLRLFAKTGEIEFGVTLQNSATPILLSAYANGIGSDKSTSVYFRIGSNCKEVGKEERGDQIKNVLLTKYQRGYVVASDSASIAARRRREDILNVDNAQSSDSALTYAAAQLDAKKDPQISHTLKAFDGVGPRLFVDYSFGDTISADKFGVVETHRVLGIQADFDGDAPSNVIIEVDTIFRDSELETSSKLDDLLTKWNTAKDGNQIEVKQWVSIGEPNGQVNALCYYAGLFMVVGGTFTNIDGKITASYIARYYPSTGQWATMGNGSVITDPVVAIAADVNGNLYCATSTNQIFLWTGTTWSLKGTASSTIWSLKGIGSELYATGMFTSINGVTMSSHVGKLNVSTWTAIGTELIQYCYEVIRYNGDLYGGFGSAGGTYGLMKYAGGVWTPVFTLFTGQVSTMAVKGDELVFAGNDDTGSYIAFWDGVSAEPTPVIYFDSVAGIFGFVRSLKVYLSDIYVSNVIYITGDDTLYNMIAKYSGGVWSVIGNGMDYTLTNTEIKALEFVDSDLYIGGLFITNDGGINNLVVWVTDFQSLIDHVNNDGANFDLGAAIHGATAATTFADGDEVGFWQAVAKGLRKITFANIKASFYSALGALIAAGTNKSTPVDADGFVMSDSAASNATKTTTWVNFKTTLKTYFDTLYPAISVSREKLTAARTYYVRTDGNDANTGLANNSGGAFLTIQKAINTVAAIDLSIYDVTIQLGDGTYTGAIIVNGPWVGSGTVTLQGNSGTPTNVFISVSGATAAITVQDGARITLKDFKIGTTSSGFGILVSRNANVVFSGLDFAACASQQLRVQDSSAVLISGNYTISGGGTTHWICVGASTLRFQSGTTTLSGTPAFTTFATCINLGMMFVDGITFSGSATGARYSVTGNGVLNTGGGGATYLPGGSAGSTASGGQYL